MCIVADDDTTSVSQHNVKADARLIAANMHNISRHSPEATTSDPLPVRDDSKTQLPELLALGQQSSGVTSNTLAAPASGPQTKQHLAVKPAGILQQATNSTLASKAAEYRKPLNHYHTASTAAEKYEQQTGGIRGGMGEQRRSTPSLLAVEDVEGFFNNLSNPPRVTCVPAEHQQHEQQQHAQLWQQQQLTQLMPAAVSSMHSTSNSHQQQLLQLQ